MQDTLSRIDVVNPVHNAIVSLRDADLLLREADERDAQLTRGATPSGPIGWMHGMPQAIKDAAQTAGIRTTFGSPLLREFVPTHLEAFELGIELLCDWRLDRYYAARIRLFDIASNEILKT